MLRSTFGDSRPIKDSPDPYNLSTAINALEAAAADAVRGEIDRDGNRVSVLSADYRRAESHARTWVERAEQVVQSCEASLAAFYQAEERAAGLVTGVAPRAFPPRLPAPSLPIMVPTPPPSSQGGSSYQAFDPREDAK